MKINDGLATRVQKIYTSSPVATAALDYFAQRTNSSTRTTIEQLLAILRQEGQNSDRGEIVDFLKALDDAGCGKFVAGRKGHPSRFEWTLSLVDVGRLAAGESIKIQPIASSDELEHETTTDTDDVIEHRYRLRPDFEVRLGLPKNLTIGEANRLSDFIRTLPF
jgi:hypothetical protein